MAFPKIEGYVVTEKLGSGSYSTVYKAHTKVGGRQTVAVKCVDKSLVKQSGAAIDNLVTEITLLKALQHPHIVQMYSFTWDDKYIYIIMEYCCGGDLSHYIRRYGRVPEKKVLYFLQQLASALKFLREKGVCHMDLKPHNLLLHRRDHALQLKVADFGFAQHLRESSRLSIRGSPLYMAPEVLTAKYDERADLWSVGVIMYECLFGKAPYSSATIKELIDKIEAKQPIQIPPNSSISAGCRELLTGLLRHDPDARISYEEFFNHEYLDLEHMPTKENYEKGCELAAAAVRADVCGRWEAALPLYLSALRYLLPAADLQPQRALYLRRLNKYMDRAEELKRFLKTGQQQVNTGSQPDMTNAAEDNQKIICDEMREDGRVEDTGAVEYPVSYQDGVSSKSSSPECSRRPRPLAGFRKLFHRESLPSLHIDNDNEAVSEKKTEDTGDMCRIT